MDNAHRRFINKEETIQIEDFSITCSGSASNDATDKRRILHQRGDKTFSFITDIGHITDTAAAYVERFNYLILK